MDAPLKQPKREGPRLPPHHGESGVSGVPHETRAPHPFRARAWNWPGGPLGPTALALWGWSPVARYAQATTPTVHDPVKVPFLTGLALLLPTLTPQVAPPV